MNKTTLMVGIRLPVALLAVMLFSVPTAAQQSCGGHERWPVKVGSDATAQQINIANAVPITLHNLIALQSGQIPGDEVTRAPSEMTVYVVSGYLRKFKFEGGKKGDSDFHLVITDNTLQFSPGGPGTTPVPHSFVAEVVQPNCIAGRGNQYSSNSHFQAQIDAVYAAFTQQFPNINKHKWNEADSIPVTITGVGFFDRDHGQTGRAANGIEIHPILNITFGAAGQPPSPATSSLILNPDFEAGPQNWTATADVITNNANEPAHTGNWKAWLGGYGEPHTDTLYQTVTIPASATAATLSFYLHISTEEQTTTEQYDKLAVELRNTSGQLLKSLAKYSNLNAAPEFQLRTLDISAYRGQTVRLYFRGIEDNGSKTSFVLDAFRILTE